MPVNIQTSIVPWLSVNNSRQALAFYKAAFNATAVYLLELDENAVVARLSADGASLVK